MAKDRVKYEAAMAALTERSQIVLVTEPSEEGRRNGFARVYVRLEGKTRWWRVTAGWEKVKRVSYDPVAVHRRFVEKGRFTMTFGTAGLIGSALAALPTEREPLGWLAGRLRELKGATNGVPAEDPALTRLKTMVERAASELTDMASQLSDDPGAEGRARALVSTRQLRAEVKGIERLLGGSTKDEAELSS